jgi:ATP-binding cassette, subfamily B, multidrug efflux pump
MGYTQSVHCRTGESIHRVNDRPSISIKNISHNTPRVLRRSFRYLLPYWKITAGAYLSQVGVASLSILIPQVIRWMIDSGIEQADTRLLYWSSAGLLLITLLRGLFAFFEGRWSEIASQNVAYDLRGDLQRKITLLSFSFHDRTETGDLLARTVQDVERIRFLTGRASLRIFEAVLLLGGTGIVLVWMNARLAALVLVFMPFLVLAALEFGRRYRPLSLHIQKQVGVLTTGVEQNLRGSTVVKAYAQEEAEVQRFQQVNEHWFQLSAYAARLQAINLPVLFLLANLGVALIVWAGGRSVVQGTLTLGEMVAFTTYLGQLINPIRRLGLIIPAVIMASTAGERIFEVLDSVPEVKDMPGAVELPSVRGQVRFQNVSFAYGKHQVLSGIDFQAEPGQLVALVGPTGSGKTSVVNLIPRFYDPSAGFVFIDGLDIREVKLTSLRRQIGIVLQETVLFSGTVRENLLFGCDTCSEEDMISAARAAQAHDFIGAMSKGYDTKVGERGVTLSGGQKQRLAIARAMLMDPRILILDDATSSVDTGTEHLIQQALSRLMQGRTSFVIAHRLSTVMRANLILVLEDGRIAARGTHTALLQSSPLYAEIYQRQLRRDEPSALEGGEIE